MFAGSPKALRAALAATGALLALAAAGAQAREIRPAAGTPKAPKVTKSPSNASAAAGASVTFASVASGSPPPTAQWEVSTNGGTNWTQIGGATSADYTIDAVATSESGYEFRVVYVNSAGSATSKAATLEVHEAPRITLQPAAAVALVGEAARFEAAATGFPSPTVHWEQSGNGGSSWANVSGADSTTLIVSSVTLAQSGRLYRATFTNVGGEAVTQPAELVVHSLPLVTSSPASVAVAAGGTATFSVAGSGVPTPTIQWQRSSDGGSEWSDIEGATESTFAIADAQTSENGFEFRAVLTNVAGSAASSPATLSVYTRPEITQQPSPTLVEEGQSAVFEAASSGFPAPTVQWEVSTTGGGKWSAVAGGTSPTLKLADVTTSEDGYLYRAKFTNIGGSATSEPARLSVDKLPAVTRQPASATLVVGHDGAFEATASGYPTPSVQWELSTDGGQAWSKIEGATSATLALTAVSFEMNGYQYRAAFTNEAGTTYTAAATLTVWVPPQVTQQPEWVTAVAGESATFDAAATGYPAPGVQWERSTNGGTSWTAIAGATSDSYSISTVHLAESGYLFRAVFTNGAGSATTEAARLTVTSERFQAVAWGQNTFRQLGDGLTTASADMPMTVANLRFVKGVAAGGHNGIAVLEDGTVHDWGSNEDGQLGDGSTGEGLSEYPVEVSGVTEATAVAAGENHCLALLANGTVVAWGAGENGQLGDGKRENRNTPVAVSGLSGVTAIAAAGNYSMALLNNGTVKAWGENAAGQLGDGSFADADVPQTVKGLSGATAISAGQNFALALLSSQKVEAWGSDADGEIPGAEIAEESEQQGIDKPVEVEGLASIGRIAAGETHGLALGTSGVLYGWGQDSYGELGNGTTKAIVSEPTAITDAGEVAEIAAGGQFSLARLNNGHLESWGINRFGMLGDGEYSEKSATPVPVAGLGEVKLIAAGEQFGLALAEPLPSISSISPSIGGASGGTSVTISGANLADVTRVEFGSTPAASFTVNSATSITAVSPPGTGVEELEVASPDGESAHVPADRFRYQEPATIKSLSAKSGPAEGGTKVVIKGSNFTDATAVDFGSTPARSFVVENETTITAYTPASVGGTYAVSVTNTDGPSAGEGKRFKFVPSVSGVAPSAGPPGGGNTVDITGTGFAPGTTGTLVRFGDRYSAEVACTSQTACTAAAPAHEAGSVTVLVVVNRAKSVASGPGDEYEYAIEAGARAKASG